MKKCHNRSSTLLFFTPLYCGPQIEPRFLYLIPYLISAPFFFDCTDHSRFCLHWFTTLRRPSFFSKIGSKIGNLIRFRVDFSKSRQMNFICFIQCETIQHALLCRPCFVKMHLIDFKKIQYAEKNRAFDQARAHKC